MICHILDLYSHNHCSKWKHFQITWTAMVAYAQMQHKKKLALRIINTLVFLKTLSIFFYGPLSLFFKVIQNLFYQRPNQTTNQTRKLQLKITPISMFFSTCILQNAHLGKHLHCTHTSTCTVNIQFWLLFFNHYLEFECPL